MKTSLIILATAALLSTPGYPQTMTYDFNSGYNGWSGDFADYPTTDSVFFELEFNRDHLPFPLDTNDYGLMLKGDNHSDDLFMFIRRKFTGLQPNTQYTIEMQVGIVSREPTNSPGIGGAPGEGVIVKAGATLFEPKKTAFANFYYMNLDKGAQSDPGDDMDTIGHIGVTDTTTQYALISRDNFSHPFVISTDSTGELWICIGTDSGYEGLTRIYYKEIILHFIAGSTGIENPELSEFRVFPNPAHEWISVTDDSQEIIKLEIISMDGRIMKTPTVSPFYVADLIPGIYLVRMTTVNRNISYSKIVKN